MSENKKETLERMANKFMSIPTTEEKSGAILCMTIYESGKAAGIEEERRRWEERQAAMTSVT